LTAAIEQNTEEKIIENSDVPDNVFITFYYPTDVQNKIAENKRKEYITSEVYIPSIDRIKKEEVQLREEETKEFVVASTIETGSPVATISVGDDTTTDYTYYATYSLTAYCATGNPCADGVYPQIGYTVASNDKNLWHKWIYIEGMGSYYVHDTGGMSTNVIDIFMGSYDECIQFGRRSANIYVYN
jgi:3D (Asp-Asp-Asp) domain-containing protein